MEEQLSKENADHAEPELLYHYTTQKGLLGILHERCIWATHFRYLNDTSEGEIASRSIWDELISRVNANPLMQFLGMPPAADGKIKCDDEGILSQGYRILSEVTSRDVYVTSLSAQGNLLSQWRAYSGESGGYSIGFSPDYLRNIGRRFLETSAKRFLQDEPLIPCQYYNDEVREKLTKRIQNSVDSYIGEAEKTKREYTLNEQTGSRTPAAVAMRHFRPLSLECAITKDYAFHEEQEWRLAFYSLNQSIEYTCFRPGRSTLTPYLKVPLEWTGQPIEIKKIYVGPCPHEKEAVKSVQMLLRKHDIREVDAEYCEIPYRW